MLIPSEAAEELNCSQLGCQREKILEAADLVLSLGGDGTLLNVAKEAAPAGIPVCGVNLGQLGFLAQIEVPHLQDGLDKLITGQYSIEERLMLCSEIIRGDSRVAIPPALNDVVVTKGGFSRLVRLTVYVGNQLTETYPADGLIAATATGSTGYSLSAGGPIVSPNVKAIVLTPICPHTLNSRSLIISEEEDVKITIQASHDDIVLTVDGQKVYGLLPDDTVMIRRSPHRARLIRFLDRGFYETLHKKLRRGD